MQKCHLAVDIGASSGRVMAGFLAGEKLQLKEIYRFDNHIVEKNGHLCWDVEDLFKSIKAGIKQTIAQQFLPTSLAIDTWAVDFVLLDEKDQLLTDAIAYRDHRTDGMMEAVFQTIDKESLYDRTGIQFQKFNTIYQLQALKEQRPEVLQQAKTFLMIPDYLHFLLTGKKANEYTNATSTQLVNRETNNWDTDLLQTLDFPADIFQEILMPKSTLGSLKSELIEEFGMDFNIVIPATHDTGSAVIAVPEQKDTIYLSSGTWSLIGIESSEPIATNEALEFNFTNEGGIDYRYRFLKNIMGLWMIQEVKRLLGNQYSFSDFVELAKEASDFTSVVDVNDDRFLSPENMIEEIQSYCKEKDQEVPRTPGEIAQTIFLSLARSYREAIEQIELVTGRIFDQVNMIGGGCQNTWLNQLLANHANRTVYAGPTEATAIGNIVVQMLQTKEIASLADARQLINRSFDIQIFEPKGK